VVQDYRQIMSKKIISRRTNRLLPELWMKFSAASLLMKIRTEGTPPNLKKSAFPNTFLKNRREGLLFWI